MWLVSVMPVSLNLFYGPVDNHSASDRIIWVGEQVRPFSSSPSSFAIRENVFCPGRFHILIPTSLSSFIHFTKFFYSSLWSRYIPARSR